MGNQSQGSLLSASFISNRPPNMPSPITKLLLLIILVGSTAPKPKYVLIETQDAPDEPMGLDAGLEEPEDPRGNNIEPTTEGSDYACPICSVGPPWFSG